MHNLIFPSHLIEILNIEGEIEAGIQYLNDTEALILINNADKLGYPVVETNNMPTMLIDNIYYQKLEDKFNSEDKLFSYLNEYYTKSGCNRIMSMLELKYIDGAYCKIVGQLGSYSPDILNAKIIRKLSANYNMELVISAMDLDRSAYPYNATFMYEDRKWRVDYWQGLMVK